jgi:hypothetical protein
MGDASQDVFVFHSTDPVLLRSSRTDIPSLYGCQVVYQLARLSFSTSLQVSNPQNQQRRIVASRSSDRDGQILTQMRPNN